MDASDLDPAKLHERRERVFLLLAGVFLGTLAFLNILGISRFIHIGSIGSGEATKVFAVAVGVLPYPITFLCTDFISELYGRRRANFVVWIGLLLNVWVVFVLWLGGVLPGFSEIDPTTGMPPPEAGDWVFFRIRQLTFGAVTASMIAYMAAQFCDVYLFHFWKRLTGGRHLWLRNNGSTLVSQMVDTTAVILITHFYAHALPVDGGKAIWPQLWLFIATGYAFKLVVALLDTVPFYVGVHYLGRYLRIDPASEHRADSEEILLALPVDGERLVETPPSDRPRV
ncbi:MAG: queuosine precursor transporter [Deltaproteobacteria bacterium]|nr:queuosine precursor transporter [Deltaproteobacteria bacterium]MBW2445148.1 queuosine precursor transporter [Deltaproteobacteria bacterium]